MKKLRVLDLFSGIGGFSLGLERTGGFETVAFCEIEPFPRKVLAKHWPKVPCYHDVKELTGAKLAADGITNINVITGGFPCQDISVAGKQAGITSETRSGLWSEIIRLAGELRPEFIIVENVANLLSGPSDKPGGWFGRVLGDLAKCGYNAEWQNIPAAALGAPHPRERVWIIAHAKRARREGFGNNLGLFGGKRAAHSVPSNFNSKQWCELEESCADVRKGNGFPVKVERDRLTALGNSVVPQIPQLIGSAILEAEQEGPAA